MTRRAERLEQHHPADSDAGGSAPQRIVVVHGKPDSQLVAILAGSGLEVAVDTGAAIIWAPPTGGLADPSSASSEQSSPPL